MIVLIRSANICKFPLNSRMIIKTLYLDPYPLKSLEYDTPIKALDYTYYPYSYRYYRPLSLYYNYYWPLSSLNRYASYWPSYYPHYKYLYYKYTLPSDRYSYLKGKIIYLGDAISDAYRVYPTSAYLRHKIYKPLGLYCDYYYPIRSLFWDSSYWPLYKTTADFARQVGNGTGNRLQRIFDDETRLIRAQTASLLKRIHDPVPRVQRYSWPVSVSTKYYDGLPARLSNDNYIHRLLMTSPKSKSEYVTYYTEPVRKYIGAGHLASVSYAGDRAYSRRPHVYLYEDPLKSDIQLMSYYINKFKQEKAITGASEPAKVPLNPARPTRKFAAKRLEDDEESAKEMQKFREARAARLAFINEEEKIDRVSVAVDDAVKAKKKKEEQRLAEEKILAEEQSKQEALAKKAEEAKKAEQARQEAERLEEIARQEKLAAKAAELERQAELARQQELEKQAEIERARQAEEERMQQEEQRRLDEEAKAEEVRKQQERLEELARQAKEEEEAELARQAEELAELARQEAELAEQAKQEAEAAELARQQEELEELERQQAELEELERKEKELTEEAERARLEAEEARLEAEEAAKREADEIARRELEAAAEEDAPPEEELIQKTSDEEARRAEEELARQQAELEELERQEAELAELERQQAELDALESEEKSQEVENGGDAQEVEEEEDEDARKQREMDELIQQKFEMAQQEQMDENEDDEEPAIAEDTPVQSDDEQ